jgi:uncharacterized protein YukE
MSQAIVDPVELRRFAQQLKHFNEELHTQLSVMHGQFQNLGATWRDQEHHKFAEEFEHTLQVLFHFTEACAEHIPFLMRKADRAEEYLQQR